MTDHTHVADQTPTASEAPSTEFNSTQFVVNELSSKLGQAHVEIAVLRAEITRLSQSGESVS